MAKKKQSAEGEKSLVSWIWDAVSSVRGAKDAPKYECIFRSRYLHTSDIQPRRPLAEIVAVLDVVEAEAREADKALRQILKKIGVRG